MFILIFQRIFLEAVMDIFYFPLWWFSGGVRYIGNKCYQLILKGNEYLAPGLWLKNLFVPMFGSRDWQGKIISFFMRLIQIIARSVALVVWASLCGLLCLGWFILPLVTLYGIGEAILNM
jgi:hypothetical protein